MKKKISNLLFKLAQKIHKRDFYVEYLNSNGILNWQDSNVSGEFYLTHKIIPKLLLQEKDSEVQIFDVGANRGNYTRMLMLGLKPLETNYSIRIHLFEPQKLVELDGFINDPKIVLNRVCVGKEDGTVQLYKEEGRENHSTTIGGVLEGNFNYRNQKKEVFPIIRLETYLENAQINRIHFLKIDTEGNEYDVLLGLGGFLEKRTVWSIQFEFNEMNVYSRVFFRDFYMLLVKDYNIFRLGTNELIPIKNYNTFLEVFKFQNYVAVLKEFSL